MRKKKLEELKLQIEKDILKELKKENKVEEQKKVVEVPHVVVHSKEELQDIQKSFLKILIFSAAVLFIFIVVFIVDPFKKDPEPTPEIQEEEKNPLTEEEEFKMISDGVIDHSNDFVLNKSSIFEVDYFDLKHYDSAYFYSKDVLNVDDFDSKYLLYLMTKTEDFKKYMDDNNSSLTTFEICNKDGVIKIPVDEIDRIILNNFNVRVGNYAHANFVYSYYIDGEFSKNIKFVYSDGYYVSTCENIEKNEYKSIANAVIKEAVKENDMLTIKVKVAFSTKDKIYSDYELTKVISNNPNADFLNYINSASDYEYVFKYVNNKYKLDQIVKK